MVKKKEITAKVHAIRKNDKRFNPKKTSKCIPKNNGNPLLDPDAIEEPQKKQESKFLDAKFLTQHIRNNQGFSTGLKKYDKRDIMSQTSTMVEEEVKLAGKITSLKPPKLSQEKPFKMLRDNGKILSQASTIAQSESLQGITANVSKNKKAAVSKNKPIARRDKLKYKPKPDEIMAKDTRKPLTKAPTKIKLKKKYYKLGMKHVKGTGQQHTPFFVPMNQRPDKKDKGDIPPKPSKYNPTGIKIKKVKIPADTIFGDAPKKKPFKRPDFHMASYSQFKFSEMKFKDEELE